MAVRTEKLYQVLSSYQHLGNTAWNSFSLSSARDAHDMLRYFLLEAPIVPVLLTFHCFFAANAINQASSGRQYWLKSLVLTTFAAFGGSTLSNVLSGAPAPLFTTASNFMLSYIVFAWYIINHMALVRSVIRFRPIKAILAFGAMAAKARTIFAFIDDYVERFPNAIAGAVLLGGLAGSGGTLFVAFERKMRLGSRTYSELTSPGWGFKSAFVAAFTYYIASDPGGALKALFRELRYTMTREDARYWISLALCSHAALETLWGAHVNPLFVLESILYAIFRVEHRKGNQFDVIEVEEKPEYPTSSVSSAGSTPARPKRLPASAASTPTFAGAKQRRNRVKNSQS